MHPILAHRDRRGAYLAGWIPLTAILAYMLALTTRLTWMETIGLSIPLSGVYALLTLSSWYLCRSVPPHKASLQRIAVTHAIAAAVSSCLWVVMAITLLTTLDLNPTSGDLLDRFSSGAVPLFVFGVLIYLLVVALHYVLLAFESSREAERREMEQRVLAGEAELKAVRAQLSPHFLFNSLNSVSALTTVDPARAREMCVLFADLLRSSLGVGEKPSITLGEELALARSFLVIESIRFGPRLTIEEDLDPGSARCAIPPLLLQPLVENAVTHGISSRLEGGAVRIRTQRSGETVIITIENPFDEEGKGTPGTGVGLESVKKRLAARYGSRATLKSVSYAGSFRVEINIPLEAS